MILVCKFSRNKNVRCAGCVLSRVRLIHLLWGSDLLGTRFLLAVSSLAWAAMLFWPGQLFPSVEQITAGTGRTTYAIMAYIGAYIGGEVGWGALFSLHGMAALIGILYDIRTRLFLWLEGILGCLLWTAATISCFVSHFHGWATYNPPAAMAAELMMTFGAWWVLVRYKAEDHNGHRQ